MSTNKDEISRKLMAMTQDDRDHIQEILALLVDCNLGGEGQAVLVFTKENSEVSELVTMNVDDEEALGLLHTAADMIRFDFNVVTPPREQFN